MIPSRSYGSWRDHVPGAMPPASRRHRTFVGTKSAPHGIVAPSTAQQPAATQDRYSRGGHYGYGMDPYSGYPYQYPPQASTRSTQLQSERVPEPVQAQPAAVVPRGDASVTHSPSYTAGGSPIRAHTSPAQVVEDTPVQGFNNSRGTLSPNCDSDVPITSPSGASTGQVEAIAQAVDKVVQHQVVTNVQIEEFSAVISSLRDQFSYTHNQSEYLHQLEQEHGQALARLRELNDHSYGDHSVLGSYARDPHEMDDSEKQMLLRVCENELHTLHKSALQVGQALKELSQLVPASNSEASPIQPISSPIPTSPPRSPRDKHSPDASALETIIQDQQEQINALQRALEHAHEVAQDRRSSRAMSFEETYARYFGAQYGDEGDDHDAQMVVHESSQQAPRSVSSFNDDDERARAQSSDDSDAQPIIYSPSSSGRSTPVKSPRRSASRSASRSRLDVDELAAKIPQSSPRPPLSNELKLRREFAPIASEAADSFVIESNLIKHAHQIEVQKLEKLWQNKERQWESQVDGLSQQLFEARESRQQTQTDCDALQVQVRTLEKLLAKRVSSEESQFREEVQRLQAAHREEMSLVRRETRQLQVDLKHEIRILQQRNNENEKKLSMLRDTDEISEYVAATNTAPIMRSRGPVRPRSAKTPYVNAPMSFKNVKAKVDSGPTKTPKKTAAVRNKNPAMTEPRNKLPE